jgi:hypothetical protein
MSVVASRFLAFVIEHGLIEGGHFVDEYSEDTHHGGCVGVSLETLALEVGRQSLKHHNYYG